jgi:hypothetical protein
MSPKKIVPRRLLRVLRRLPFWIAFTASAIKRDDIRRMNVEKEVSSIEKMVLGSGEPAGGLDPIHDVHRDERAEEHAVGREERPHEQFLVRDARRRAVAS